MQWIYFLYRISFYMHCESIGKPKIKILPEKGRVLSLVDANTQLEARRDVEALYE